METQQSLEYDPLTVFEANFQGIDGPVSFSEHLFQKIWSQQNFITTNLKTQGNTPFKIINPGTWNFSEGPDFLNATLEISNQLITGDIELHFYTEDWFHHNHHTNNNFDNVILHVTLFEPPLNSRLAFNSNGYTPHHLSLLSYLHQSIEEYAYEETLLNLSNDNSIHPSHKNFFSQLSSDYSQELYNYAKKRWYQKYSFIQKKLNTYGLEETCHQLALEVLGYNKNRCAMIEVALNYPFHSIQFNPPQTENIYHEFKNHWKTLTIRPANHPKKRLEQYFSLLKNNPTWPESLLKIIAHWPHPPKDSFTTKEFRKKYNLKSFKDSIMQDVLHNIIGSSRLDTLIVNAFIPIIGIHLQKDLFQIWYHWFPGDTPNKILYLIKHFNLSCPQNNPLSNGIIQSMIGFLCKFQS